MALNPSPRAADMQDQQTQKQHSADCPAVSTFKVLCNRLNVTPSIWHKTRFCGYANIRQNSFLSYLSKGIQRTRALVI
jgi:hypothetical protein